MGRGSFGGGAGFQRDSVMAADCIANQVYYSASERGIEFDLLPAQRRRAVATMAYCPIDQGALASDTTFAEIGRAHGVSAAQAALAWVLRQRDVGWEAPVLWIGLAVLGLLAYASFTTFSRNAASLD